jgi:lipoprotein-anchoring transpeptidase ErfK/SrfK
MFTSPPNHANLSIQMDLYRRTVTLLIFAAGTIGASAACAQIELPRTAPTTGRDTSVQPPNSPAVADSAAKPAEPTIELRANLRSRILSVQQGGNTIKTYAIAVGQDRSPTPLGTFSIRRMIWNPSWRPPPGADWAKGKTAQGPGDPKNPMKVVKIFFKEPDYYIHGTGDVESLGSAASHGCLRMDPEEIADLAKLIMEHGGQPREENWFWRLIHFRREEKPIYLDNPISLTITD